MCLQVLAQTDARSTFKLSEMDCAAAARRRRRNLLIILGLSALSWLMVGALVAAVA
jgi:hypothetical protein